MIYRNAIASDTYFHLDIAEKMRDNRFRVPQNNSNYILNHIHLYPHFYHLILSLFKKSSRLWTERISGPFFDTSIVYVLYFFLRKLNIQNVIELSDFTIYCSMILTGISPAYLRITGGPRAYSGSPRVLGQLLYFIHVCFFLLFHFSAAFNFYYLFISILALALLLFTAKFGFQVFVFMSPLFLYLDYKNYLIITILGLFLAFIFSGGTVLQIIKYNIKHSIYYYKFSQKRVLYPSHIVLSKYIKELIFQMRIVKNNNNLSQFKSWFYNQNFSIHLLFTSFLHIILIITIFLFKHKDEVLNTNLLFKYLFLITLLSLTLFFIMRNKPFLFLGEAERYLEYTLPFSITFFVCYSSTISYAFIALYVLCVLIFFILGGFAEVIESLAIMNKEYTNWSKIARTLKLSPNSVVLPLNYSICKHIVFHIGCKVLSYYPGSVDTKILPIEEIRFIYEDGGHNISKNLASIIKKYKVNYIHTTKEYWNYYIENKIEKDELLQIEIINCYHFESEMIIEVSV